MALTTEQVDLLDSLIKHMNTGKDWTFYPLIGRYVKAKGVLKMFVSFTKFGTIVCQHRSKTVLPDGYTTDRQFKNLNAFIQHQYNFFNTKQNTLK